MFETCMHASFFPTSGFGHRDLAVGWTVDESSSSAWAGLTVEAASSSDVVSAPAAQPLRITRERSTEAARAQIRRELKMSRENEAARAQIRRELKMSRENEVARAQSEHEETICKENDIMRRLFL